jgi:hypothetical protein
MYGEASVHQFAYRVPTSGTDTLLGRAAVHLPDMFISCVQHYGISCSSSRTHQRHQLGQYQHVVTGRKAGTPRVKTYPLLTFCAIVPGSRPSEYWLRLIF